MKTLFTWIGKSMEEAPGEPSAVRVVMVAGLMAIIALWCAACVWNRSLVEIPGSVLGFAGSLLTAKFAQKFAENKPPPP